MLVGRPPFEAGTLGEQFRQHAYGPPPPPSELIEAVPPALETLVLRALAKDPAARFANAGEMLRVLDGLDAADPPAPQVPAGPAFEPPPPPAATPVPAPDAGPRRATAAGLRWWPTPLRPRLPLGSAAAPPGQPAANTPPRARRGAPSGCSSRLAVPALIGLLAIGYFGGVPGSTPAPEPSTGVLGGVLPPVPLGWSASPQAVAAATPSAEAPPGGGEPSAATAVALARPPAVLATPVPIAVPSRRATPTAAVPGTATTATPELAPLRLLTAGFGQQEQVVGFGFAVQNPNSGADIVC
jgi:serine/threonine-protein kinase